MHVQFLSHEMPSLVHRELLAKNLHHAWNSSYVESILQIPQEIYEYMTPTQLCQVRLIEVQGSCNWFYVCNWLQTAQLRLENACLRRKSNVAVQLAEKYEEERSILARKIVELEKQVVKARETSSGAVKDSGDDSVTTQQTRTHVGNQVLV